MAPPAHAERHRAGSHERCVHVCSSPCLLRHRFRGAPDDPRAVAGERGPRRRSTRLSWREAFRATITAATGISVLSFLLVLYVSLGANFEKHYATSGLAALVLLAVWLFLANVLVLASYRVVLET